MENFREFAEDPKHKNWLKGVVALKNLQELLEPFIDKEIEIFHRELQLSVENLKRQSMGNECGPDHCVKECVLRNWKPRPNQIPPLDCEVCSRWSNVIWTNSNQHGKVMWLNSKPHLWSREKWEVAKVYMPEGHKDHNSVGDFDIAAFLRLMNQCKHFKKFELGGLCDKVSKVRNNIMHAPMFQLEQKDLHDCFSRIRELGEELARHVPEFKSFSEDIDEILNLDYRLIFPDDMAAQEILKSQHEKDLEDLLYIFYTVGTSRTQEDRARLLEETDAAYAPLQAATQEAEARVKEAQARQVSTAANLFSLESPDSDTENVSAANPSSQTLGWTPSNPITRDGHRAQVAARPMDTGALPSRSVSQSIQSRATLRFDLSPPPLRTGVSYSREVSGFRSSYADDRSTSRSSRPNPNRTPPPTRRRSNRPSRLGDPSDYGSSDDSDRGYPPRSHGLRTHQLESLAKDIERFDSSSRESNIDDYLREIERCLLDLPHASSREELKLVWKTTARSVHVFMESLAPQIRDCYPALCNALREEYSPYTDPASATLGAFAVMHKKHESPRDYYRRLRAAYFQGRNAPGLEEEQTFKSLFLHNLHESVRYGVTMSSRSNNLSMHEIRRYAQMAWETQTRPVKWQEDDAARVLGIQSSESNDLALEGNEMPCAWENARVTYQGRQPPRQYGSQPPLQHGNQQNQGGW